MILNDLLINVLGNKVVQPFNKRLINPNSYDVNLSKDIYLQVFKGIEYPDVPAMLYYNNGIPYIKYKYNQIEYDEEALFLKGDLFLGSTVEYVSVPRWLVLELRLKSSVARVGLNHLYASHIDSGFNGKITLELQCGRSMYVYPNLPFGQLIYFLAFPVVKKYTGRYQNQSNVTVNRNISNCAVRPAISKVGGSS